MKIVFISNFMNHHQLPFCQEMVKNLGDDFKFIATEKIPDDRIKLGYKDMNKKYNFIVRSYDNEEETYKLLFESDVIIIGSAPDKYIHKALREKKVIFRYSERVFKHGFKIKSFLSILLKRTIKERNNSYLLCASAFSSYDYNKAFAYKNKAFKWGYFPEVNEYKHIKDLINNKEKKSIIWVSRFIDWKHPEIPIKIAKKLKDEQYDFIIYMIGNGEELYTIQSLIEKNNLMNNVKLLGAMSPDKVRNMMERSKIFLFTSDKGEGWGAVLNEAMNSACAVVASHEIGSVPYLINNNKNGLIYKDGNIEDLYYKVKKLLDNDELTCTLGFEAYKTMIKLWNPKIAAKRIIELANALLEGDHFDIYKEGPCSKAEIIKDNWITKRM